MFDAFVAFLFFVSTSFFVSSSNVGRVKRFDWQDDGKVYWSMNCDFFGGDLREVKGPGEQCGPSCASTDGCKAFTWTNQDGGTCYMKSQGFSRDQARHLDNAVCGVKKDGGPTPNGQGGITTRYWDCCKTSCAWNGKASVTQPVQTCQKDGDTRQGDVNAQSGCGGGNAYVCNNQQPWVASSGVAYGFAAAHIAGKSERDTCCACYELKFTSGQASGKTMIVQAINTGGDLGKNQFDLQIPGGGVGLFNGCTSQWGAPQNGWGQQYGGVGSRDECNSLPGPLQNGCRFRFDFLGDNPTMNFKEVGCPTELTSKTGCSRT